MEHYELVPSRTSLRENHQRNKAPSGTLSSCPFHPASPSRVILLLSDVEDCCCHSLIHPLIDSFINSYKVKGSNEYKKLEETANKEYENLLRKRNVNQTYLRDIIREINKSK